MHQQINNQTNFMIDYLGISGQLIIDCMGPG